MIGGVANLAANWDNIDGFWQGAAAVLVGAGSGAAVAATGGAGAGALATIGASAATGAVTSMTNSIIAQTGKNFSGIENVNWGEVGINGMVGALSGAASGATGYYAQNIPIKVQGISIKSPILKSAIASPLFASAGHVVGGTAYGLCNGHSFKTSFKNSLDGIWKSMAINGAIGVASTAGICYVNKVNPWTGREIYPKNINGRILRDRNIYATQSGLNRKIVDSYLSQMESGTFNNDPINIMRYNGRNYITDGHHRMTAAFRYYVNTGSTFYLDLIMNNAHIEYVNPANYNLKKTNLW